MKLKLSLIFVDSIDPGSLEVLLPKVITQQQNWGRLNPSIKVFATQTIELSRNDLQLFFRPFCRQNIICSAYYPKYEACGLTIFSLLVPSNETKLICHITTSDYDFNLTWILQLYASFIQFLMTSSLPHPWNFMASVV